MDLLSHVTLGGGVERCQFHYIRVLWPHVEQNLLEGVELATLSVHIVLVHLEDKVRRTAVTGLRKH